MGRGPATAQRRSSIGVSALLSVALTPLLLLGAGGGVLAATHPRPAAHRSVPSPSAVAAPRLDGPVTDLSGVVGDDGAALAAIARLHDRTGTDLYVLLLPTTDGVPIGDFVSAVLTSNEDVLTPDDAVVVIATDDRQYWIETGNALTASIPQAELDVVAAEWIRPRLAEDDWAGAIAAAAQGLEAAVLRDVTTAGGPLVGSRTPCTSTLPVGTSMVRVAVGDTEREVLVHVPAARADTLFPAAIGFHGFSAHASDLEATSGLSALADEQGFVVAYVQGAGDNPDWTFEGHPGTEADDLGLTAAVLDRLVSEACVDPARMILFGHSMGGGMASAAACALSDEVAGVVLVAAFWAALPCEPSRPVPVVAMHALDDPVLPYGGGTIGGGGPRVLGVEEALAAWAGRDGCATGDPAQQSRANGTVELAWAGCDAAVTLLRLATGGHAWPALATDMVVRMVLGRP